MNHTKKLWISGAILLVGCNSFNRYELREDQYPRVIPQYIQVERDLEVRKSIEVIAHVEGKVCPPFQMPALPATPELPYKELAAIKPTDTDAIDGFYQKHIMDLRKHSTTVQKILSKAYGDYIKQCAAYASKGSQQ